MASVILSGDTSGTVTLSAPAVSGSSVLTLPVATDTLVGKATTDTLTNKTLTGAVFTAMPATTTAQSMVRLNTANGYGSTNTKIRRFTTTVTNQGSDITYADSATLGASFTINTNGVYAITHTDVYSASSYCGISLNTTEPTVGINSLANAGEILVIGQTSATTTPTGCSWTGYLASGSVIRAHELGTTSGTPANCCNFTITRVA